MLTGIMAMFEMATSYVQFQNTWEPSKKSQDLSKEYLRYYADTDRNIIKHVKDDKEKKVCAKARAAADPLSLFKDNDGKKYLSEYVFYRTVSSFPEGCYYQSPLDPAKIGHRIIFDKNDGHWSCALASGTASGTDQSKCDFEL